MKEELKHIVPGVGLGNLKFGMIRDEVKNLLGEPNDIDEYSYSDDDNDLTEDWYYDDLYLSIGFDEEDNWKLVTIAVNSTFYEFDNNQLIDLDKDKVVDLLTKSNIIDLEFEQWSGDESSNNTLISSEKNGLNIWLDNEKVTEIQIEPLYDENENIKWPSL